jgi:LysR family transcriptional activator of nhaA
MEWLNYHHLLYFWTVAREGTIARASEKLLLAQPTISAQIKALEASLGKDLFERRGRRLALTETGEMVYGYANEIFSIGREMLSALRQEGRDRPLRLHVGITDSLPKLVVHELLKPAYDVDRPLQLICREGKIGGLLSELATHQLDVVLADTPGSPDAAVRSYNHRLGDSSIVLIAETRLARKLKRDFPASLDDAPAVLPTPSVATRPVLDRWFTQIGVTPRIVAEVEDSALTKVFAGEGLGFIALPGVIAETVCQRYGLQVIGEAEGCSERFYAITVERRLKHPAVIALSEAARDRLFA